MDLISYFLFDICYNVTILNNYNKIIHIFLIIKVFN